MLTVIIGCEYAGTTTIAWALAGWLAERDSLPVRVHDHWVWPHLTDQDPSTCYLVGPQGRVLEPDRYDELGGPSELRRLGPERAKDIERLNPWMLEQLQRAMVWRHLHPTAYQDAGHAIQVNFYYAEAVYAPMYYAYGGPGSFADRSRRAGEWDSELMRVAADPILVLVTGSPEVVRARMRTNPHPASGVKEADAELVLQGFQDAFDGSRLHNKVRVDTSGATVSESLAELAEALGPYLD